MKKTIIVVAAASVVVVIGGILRNCSASSDERSRVPIERRQSQPRVTKRDLPANQKKELESYKPTEEELKAINETEAVLYGIVIDLNNNPVPNAEIVCLPNHDPWVSGLRRIVINADQNGRFLIREKSAPTIDVSVSAKGYYTTEGSGGSFGFAEPPISAPKQLRLRSNGTTQTSQENPKIFTLRKMGTREPLLRRNYAGVTKEHQFYLIGIDPNQRILVKYFLDPTQKRIHANGWEIYNWGFEISIENGGLIKAEVPQNETPNSFIAPSSGYGPSIRFEFDDSMDDSTFQRHVNSQFFAKFADGTYARFSVAFEMDPKRPFGSVESWFNPSGGRATEFDPSIQIEISP